MSTPSAVLPTPSTERIELIDALRGFALFGVLLINLQSLSLYGLLTETERQALPTYVVDQWLAPFTDALVAGTSVTLFSILFGVGFAMQMQRASGRADGTARYVRRLLVLLVFGLAHALLWWGDILRYYAVLGLLLIPLARLPRWALAGLGVVIVVVAPVVLRPWVPALLPPQISSAESAAISLAAFRSDDWIAVLSANFDRDIRMRIAVWMLPAYVLGRLMVGAALGRSGVLQQAASHRQFWRRLWIGMICVSALLLVLAAMRSSGTTLALALWPNGPAGNALNTMIRFSTPFTLGLAYIAGFVLLYMKPGARRRMVWLVPVGRMALTNYLAQTLIGIGLFYGIGFGIGPSGGLIGLSLAAVLIFAAQAWFSERWLRSYRQGPMEWLWRRLTYGKPLPLPIDARATGLGTSRPR